MGLMDRIKKVTGTNDSYDDSYDDDYYDGFDGYEEEVDDGDIQMAQPNGMNNAPMGGMGAQMGGISLNATGSSIQMKVVRPRAYDSETATQIADHLLNKCTVVLNLENTNKEASRRLIDFLTGVAYSIGGSIKQVSTNTYLVAPSSVDVADSKIKQAAARRQEPQPEAKEINTDDFGDFN
ncbi:MAG: cell division protein SepF [Clostridia bacterium]|nr:cell division protein SepF [Clostridia bacterium]MBQ8369283.1 cell division protein SepF [Clostridia bacterium]